MLHETHTSMSVSTDMPKGLIFRTSSQKMLCACVLPVTSKGVQVVAGILNLEN